MRENSIRLSISPMVGTLKISEFMNFYDDAAA